MRRNNLYRAIEPDMKAEDFINQYLDQNQKYYREFSKLHRLTEAAEMFDLPIFDLIKDSGFNRKDLATFIGKRRNFQPLGLTENLQLQILESSKSFDEFYDIVSDINEIDRQLSNLPVLIDDEIYKVMEEEESQPEQVFERLQKTAGGIVRGPAVPFTKENPADRINPMTGEPYQEQMSRLGFAEGGDVSFFNKVIQAIKAEKNEDVNRLVNFAQKVRNVESANNYQAVQKGSGIAKGAYQYEGTKGSNAVLTGVNRLIRIFEGTKPDYMGDILVGDKDIKLYERARQLQELGQKGKDIDLSKESPEFQDALFLADKIYHPKFKVKEFLKGNISDEDAWLNYHWSGDKSLEEEKRQLFRNANQ